MRIVPVLAFLSLALAGCAQTGVSLFGGEKDANGVVNPTGAVAVLDPVTGQEIGTLDQADISRAIRKNKIALRKASPEQLQKRYGALLSSLPESPKLFILLFKPNSTELVDESRPLLQELLAEVQRRPGADVQIVGHTDRTGSEEDNDSLSVKRAEDIKSVLTGLGLDSQIVRATGRGEREPREETPDETPSELNRRVEVFVK